ncbi:MAG: ribokinase [Blastopirellula sp. JB062]
MSNSTPTPKVTVVGSINMDLVLRTSQFPQPGETIAALSYHENPGGKGANQAVSAARAGAQVAMIGRVGDDAFADRLTGELRRHGVDCSAVLRTSQCASGLAVINVDDDGQNMIVVVGGANAQTTATDIESLRALIAASDALLVQLEVPLATVLAAIQLARAAQVRVILDPAPAPSAFPDELLQVNLICPNERELAQLTGMPTDSVERLAAAAAELRRRGAQRVAVTLGGQGTYLVDDDGARTIPAVAVDPVDTTAAGDAFAGALAVRWAEQDDLDEAVRFANAAGAIAASRLGAQASMGSRSEIERLKESLP